MKLRLASSRIALGTCRQAATTTAVSALGRISRKMIAASLAP